MIVLMAGPIAAGKSTVARLVMQSLGGTTVVVREALHHALGAVELDRHELQRLGADLDQRTRGRWLVDYLEQIEVGPLVVDSLRTVRQTVPILDHFVDARLVYVNAHEETRRRRYRSAGEVDKIKRAAPFDDAMNHPTELQVSQLIPLAHVYLETDDLTAEETMREVLKGLRT